MNLRYMTQKQDAARLWPRWIWRKGKSRLFLPHWIQHTLLTQSYSTQREKLPESLKTRLLKGLRGHLF